jgi:two-component sensor histidine kinase
VIAKAIAPHVQRELDRFRISGPGVRLSPQQAVAMALAVHELTTNALKHGALSSPHGSVEIDWNLSHDGEGGRHLTLTWIERGGPSVSPPTRRGFGSRLLARTFQTDTGGRAEIKYNSEGVECVIELSLSEPHEAGMMDMSASQPPGA